MTERRRIPILAGAGALVLLSGSASVMSAPPARPLSPCLEELGKSAKDDISCDYVTLLTDEERADLTRLTRGVLQDASCRVAVRIARDVVAPALSGRDYVFESPPQQVSCEIKTSRGAVPLTGVFAPRVVFKDGKAVEASPGLGNVAGVSGYLSWPAVQYVNHAPGIRREMLATINAYRSRIARNER